MLKTLIEKSKKVIAFVNCIKCGKRTFKKVELQDGSFYWKCTSCLYETKKMKRSN